jgi:hypothetical protein
MAGFIMATTTPNYGWDVPTSTDYVKDGATAIETLGDDIDATLYAALGGSYPGLRLVKKQTIGTGVSSVVVNSAFSATYENYLIRVSGGVASAISETNFSFNGITGSVYLTNLQYNSFGATTPLASTVTSTFWQWCGNNATNGMMSTIDVTAPFLSQVKTMRSTYTSLNTGGVAGSSQGLCNSTTSATGFTLTPNTGTLSGGTVYVYGYGIS